MEPTWLIKEVLLAAHDQQLEAHGGSAGVRDMGLFESAIARPKMLFKYEGADVFELAAAYADGIANNHPFIDGNKRTALVAAALFLEINGCRLQASEAEAVVLTIGLADKTIDRVGYAAWLRDSSKKV